MKGKAQRYMLVSLSLNDCSLNKFVLHTCALCVGCSVQCRARVS